MKKTIFYLIFISLCVFISCNPDDSTNIGNDDPIVGDWKRLKEVYIFDNDSIVVTDFPECSNTNFLVFMDEKHNRFFSLYLYFPIESSNSCQLITGEGKWTKILNGRYSVNVAYFEENDPYNIGEETILYEATFPAPDSLHLHNLSKLEEYQTEMEGLLDFYTVYKLDDGGIDDGPNFP